MLGTRLVEAQIRALDPRTNSWLWHTLELDDVHFVEAGASLLAITAQQAKLADPTSEEGATLLAAATEALGQRIDFASGPEHALAAFVRARSDAALWRCLHTSTEMAAVGTPDRAVGTLHQVSALAPSSTEQLPQPFAQWMGDFTSSFAPGDGPPPVSSRELWTLHVDGVARAMAGALRRGVDGVRIVTVYTPPSERGRGYAGALIGALTEHVRAHGALHVTLDVLAGNEPARRAYLRAGFRDVAQTARWARRPMA